MEKYIFRKVMDNEVIQKTVIFADVFNLNIDGWKPSNTLEHPYRIVFYNNGMIVGYIDAKSNDNDRNNMPFVLFTPLGKVIGYFSTKYQLFSYNLYKDYKREDLLDDIKGNFVVRTYGPKHDRKYHISADLTLGGLNKNRIQVSFNKMASNCNIQISKGALSSLETVALDILGSHVTLYHFDYPHIGRRVLTKIVLNIKEGLEVFPAIFEFLNCVYKKYIGFEEELTEDIPYYKRLSLVDFGAIYEEIIENDSRMYSLIDEVRDSLTLLANGITPVSIYDKLAQLCFYDETDKFKLNFTRSQNVEIALKHNLVLKKMNNHVLNKG